MSDTTEPIVEPDAEVEGGLSADHPTPQTHSILVGPTVAGEFNTIRAALVPVGCWRLEDLRFEFDSSIIKPEAVKEFRKLAKLCADHPAAPISLFGHADPVGNDAYNKELSGRRAEAVYALLTRDTGMWEKLYNSQIQGVGDAWKYKATQVMLKALGHDPGPATGSLNAQTVEAVKSFQRANDLKDDGDPGPLTRGKLFPQYMDKICQESSGKPFKLAKTDFLGKGAGPDLKADLQGCSEFNPVLMFSNAEKQAFDNPARKQDRDAENGPNRRVMALLFRPGTKVNPAKWPCPTTKEGTAKCEARFWSDAATRRQFQAKRRKFEDDKDTFACRFYHRLMTSSPCEGFKPVPPPEPLETVEPLIVIVTVLEEGAGQAAGALEAKPKPSVKPEKKVIVVKRPYTAPARQTVLLKTKTEFNGTGTFERSSDRVRFFRKGVAEEMKFDGKDNLFQGADLTKGEEVFAEGVKASDKIDDITLTLTLSGGSKKPGPPATAKITSVEIKLDICEPRTSAADPPVLATPAAAPAAGASSTDKFFGGRPVPLQTDKNFDERAMLIVRQVKPEAFKGKLVLKSENDKVKLFEKENFDKDEKPLPTPHVIDAASIKAPGLKLFAEGAKESASARDTGFRLGVEGITDDGDRVSMTVCHCEIVSNKEPKDLKLLAQVPEKPERKTKSKFVPAPLIVGLEYDIELRHFIEIAKPSAFLWSTPSNKVNLTDTSKEILKLKPKTLSGALDDVDLDLLLTTDIGKLKKKHKLTCVRVEMNPVISGDNLKHTDDINIIRNPCGCVILTFGDAADEKKVPKYEITKIEPNLAWTDDDDRIAWWIIGGEGAGIGNYDGKADFLNDEKAKRGTKIQVFGTKRGDVLIQPYSGGFGYGMFRANVVMPRQLKYRVNRIIRKGNPAATPPVVERGPTASHADAKLHIKVVNLYLRQAGIEMVPDDSAEMASSAGNTKVGLAALDSKIVSVTKSSDGHFDVAVNDVALTFGGTADDVRSAMRINARNEVISLAYVNSDATGSLAAARGYPINHAPENRADPPRAYTKASFTIKDKGVPSSSLKPKTGIPPDVPVDEVKMVVLKQHFLLSFEGSSPATRNVNLLWGASVPTTAIDATGTGGDSTILAYANTIAHELCHVLGMGHRGVAGDTFEDGLTIPANENLMHPSNPPPRAQNLDIIQVKAIRFSEVVFRFP